MDIVRAQAAIKRLNGDLSTLSHGQLWNIEEDLGLASGQLSERRITLPGDQQRLREEVRQNFLGEAAYCQAYLEPDASFPPAAINATPEELLATKVAFLALATQVRR